MGHLGGAGHASGMLKFDGIDLLRMDEAGWARLRGRRMGMVYQEPQSALNPAYTIGEQIAEGREIPHGPLAAGGAWAGGRMARAGASAGPAR